MGKYEQQLPLSWSVPQRIECPNCGEDARMHYRVDKWVWIECKAGCRMSGTRIDVGTLGFVASPPVSEYPASISIIHTLREMGVLGDWQSSPVNQELHKQIREVIGSIAIDVAEDDGF